MGSLVRSDRDRFGGKSMPRQAFSRLLVAAMAVAFALNVSANLSAQEPPPPAMPESNAADAETPPSESSSPLAPRAMNQILPYGDYDPQLPSDTAHLGYLCPHPDGSVCQPMAEGEEEPIRCPPEIDLAGNPYQEKMFVESMFLWEASNVFHNPLYFEDAPLERYGHTHHKLIQPLASVGLFGTQLLGLPY